MFSPSHRKCMRTIKRNAHYRLRRWGSFLRLSGGAYAEIERHAWLWLSNRTGVFSAFVLVV
jgi:hypothetical protein